MEQLYPTRKLTWPEAANLAQKRVEEILHKEVSCQMALEDETYWTLYSPTYMFSTKELDVYKRQGLGRVDGAVPHADGVQHAAFALLVFYLIDAVAQLGHFHAVI